MSTGGVYRAGTLLAYSDNLIAGGQGGGGPLILDNVAGATAAYSLRRVRRAYAGAAVNVRRSSDNATQDIGFAGDNFNVTAFSAFVGGGTGFIATWYDQVGSANATQATAANQPTIVTGITPSGRASGYSAAATSLLAGTLAVAQTDPHTLVTVCNRTTLNGSYHVPFGLQGGPQGNNTPIYFYLDTANAGLLLAYNGVQAGGGQQGNDNVFHSAIGVVDVAGSNTVDGTTLASSLSPHPGATAVNIFSVNLLIGLIGYVAEGIYFGAHAVSAGDIATIHTDHASYYGTP